MSDRKSTQDSNSEPSDETSTQEMSEVDEGLEATHIVGEKTSSVQNRDDSIVAPESQTENDAEWEQIANILTEQRNQAEHQHTYKDTHTKVHSRKLVNFGTNIVIKKNVVQTNKEQIRHRGVNMVEHQK